MTLDRPSIVRVEKPETALANGITARRASYPRDQSDNWQMKSDRAARCSTVY